jgi:hypothetical protein
VKLRRDPNCPLCGKNPTIKDLSIHMEGAAQACALGDNGPTHAFGAGAPPPPSAVGPAADVPSAKSGG